MVWALMPTANTMTGKSFRSAIGCLLRLRPGTAFGQTARARTEWISLDGKPIASGIVSTPDGRIRSCQAPALRLLRTTVAVPRGTILLFPDCGNGIPPACHDGMPTILG